MKVTSFPPIASEEATVLILGTMPGSKSLRLEQYYAGSGNSFWEIMQFICRTEVDLTYAERERSLVEKGIALWDVLKHCEREGSLDSAIKTKSEIPNDFEQFFQSHPNISHIFFNGIKAEKSFRKLVLPLLPATVKNKMTLRRLPSTSAAHTGLTKMEKIEEWKKEIDEALV